ncbi:sugar-binding transcriptional regulator [Clostridium sp.]
MDIDKLNEKERYDMLAEMADLYYNQGKTQSEIAQYFETNRFRVAKLLQDARNEQIVEIRINYSNERNTVLEAEVREKLVLNQVIVVNSQYATYTDSLNQMGKAGAAYLGKLLQRNRVIGLTWGKTIGSVVAQLPTVVGHPVDAVQMTGYMKTANASVDARELVRQVAAAYNGDYFYLNTPLYMKNAAVMEALCEEPIIRETLDMTRRMDVILSGIGGKSSLPTENPMIRPYLDETDRKAACGGSLYGFVLDADGKAASIDLNQRRMGAKLEDIMQVPHRLVVACGRHKADILKKAAQNGLYNELVTDSDTALHILEN